MRRNIPTTTQIGIGPNGKKRNTMRSLGNSLAYAPRIPLIAPDAPTTRTRSSHLRAAKNRVPHTPVRKYITMNGRAPILCSNAVPRNARHSTFQKMCPMSAWVNIDVRIV